MSNAPLQTNANFQLVLTELEKLGQEAASPVSADPVYREFIQKFPADQLHGLSLNDYCVGKGDGNSFCWWLERGLQQILGRYAPGTSKGHLLYFQKDGTVYKNRLLKDLEDNDALAYTLRIQAAIAQADVNADLSWIDDDELLYQRAGVKPRVTVGHGRKLRLVSCYHPDETLPISSSSHLGHFLQVLGCQEAEIPDERKPIARMMLLRKYLQAAQQAVPGTSSVSFIRALYNPLLGLSPIDEKGGKEVNTEEELSITLTAGAIKNGYVRIPKNQRIFSRECIAEDERSPGELFTLMLPDGTKTRTCLLANKGRIKSRFNALFANQGAVEGDRARIQKTSDGQYKMSLEMKDLDDEITSSVHTGLVSNAQSIQQPLNQILYGPPGTGKTYSTIDAALAILDPGFLERNDGDRKALKARFDALAREQRIRFVTFHQSFSYEDFVEGLRATTNEDTGQIRYEMVDGVFKSLCEAAGAKVTRPHEAATTATPFNIQGRRIWKMSLGNTLGSDAGVYDECIEKGYALLGYGEGVDFTGCSSRDDVIRRFIDSGHEVKNPLNDYAVTSITTFVTRMKPGDLIIVSDGLHKFRAIGEISSDYLYRPGSEDKSAQDSAFAEEYMQMRAVKWLRTYEPSLPYGELMNNQFSQMTLYELRHGSIDVDKLQGLLNQKPSNPQAWGGLVPGPVKDSSYEIVRANADIVELKKPQGRMLALGASLVQELAQAVKTGLITINDIRDKRVMEKLPTTTMDPFLVNGYNDVLAPLVAQLVGVDASGGGDVADFSATPPDARVLIIDEINRGNISRIFGELITLIEPSKRVGADEALEIVLPYSKKPFAVPQNVYLIGTMNTADRSLTGMDVALRRRFVFKEMPPRPALLQGVQVGEVPIDELLKVLNQRIEALLDRDHCIGHAYFLPLKDEGKLYKLAEVFKNQVLPLLQEYFFDDWQRIQWVLNDHRKADAYRFVSSRSVGVDDLFGAEVNVADNAKAWSINEKAFQFAESYLGVIDHRLAQSGE